MQKEESKNEDHLKFMLCHDGSDASIEALMTVRTGYMAANDHLCVAHAWSREKEEYLTYNLKRDYIKQQNEDQHIYLGSKF